jgi:hypothetical protein
VRVQGGDLAGRGRTDVGDHRQRDVEVVVGVRTPGQAEVVAELGDAHGAAHGPEVRVGQRDVDRVGADGVSQLPPVGGDHVGRGAQPGGPAELGHRLPARQVTLGTDGVLGVRQDAAEVAAEADRVGEQPAAVRVERDPGPGERRR